MTALANFPSHLCRRASMYQDAKLRGLLLTLFCAAAGVFVACNGEETGTGPTARPTVDILSTVDARIAAISSETLAQTYTSQSMTPPQSSSIPPASPTPYPTYTPYPTHTPYPTYTPQPMTLPRSNPAPPASLTPYPDLHALPDPHPISFPYCHEGAADIHAGASPTDSRIVPIADPGAPSPIP